MRRMKSGIRTALAGTMMAAILTGMSTACGQGLVHVWSQAFGARSYDRGLGVAVDAAGNSILTGYFYYTVGFGGEPITSAGHYDGFLAKYAPDGSHLWSRQLGGTDGDYALGVAVDPAGNIVVTGVFNGTTNLGGDPIASVGGEDIFIARYAPDGSHLWSRGFGSPEGHDGGFGITVGGDGNIVVTGSFSGTMNLGGTPLASAGEFDVFVAMFDADGTHLWSRGFGGSHFDRGSSVAVASNGNIAVTGYFQDTMQPGNQPITSAGAWDVFVVNYAPNGAHLWSHGFGSTAGDYGWGVALDGHENTVLTGSFRETVSFGGPAITSMGGLDFFIAKLAPDGTHIWSRGYGGPGDDRGHAIACDSAGDIHAAGRFESSVLSLGGPLITSQGAADVFVAKYGPGGAHLWSRGFGGPDHDDGHSIALDASSSAIVTGAFQGTASFGGEPFTSVDDDDIFIAKYSPTCSGDVNADGGVDVADLLLLLAAWGTPGAGGEDINGDGVVDVQDLLLLLAAWGPCP